MTTLDEAWAEAMAALPADALVEIGNKPDGSWWANCLRRDNERDSWTGFRPLVDGPTPTAALQALVVALHPKEER